MITKKKFLVLLLPLLFLSFTREVSATEIEITDQLGYLNIPVLALDKDINTGVHVNTFSSFRFRKDEEITKIRVYIEGAHNVYSTLQIVDPENKDNILKKNSTLVQGWNDIVVKDVFPEHQKIKVSYFYFHNGYSQVKEIEIYGIFKDDVPPANVTNVQTQQIETGVKLTFDKPLDNDLSHYEIYKNDVLLSNNYKLLVFNDNEINPLTEYKYKVVSVDTSGNKSAGVISTIISNAGPDLIAPSNITDIKSSVSDKSVTFTYTKPTDPDFSHYIILRDNDEIITNHNQDTFTDTKLTPETSYTYIFKSVDMTGNVSVGTSVTIKTNIENDDVAPEAPKGLEVKNANAGLMVSWNSNTEPDLVGYNVYLDGIKQNTSLLPNNFYNVYNLTNNTTYTITVTAVDTSGNESLKSITKSGTPNHEEMPILEIKTDLKAVAKSTESWFSQLWLIVAFASSIPLSFLVARGVKGLFLS